MHNKLKLWVISTFERVIGIICRSRKPATVSAVALAAALNAACVSTGQTNGAVTDDAMEVLVVSRMDRRPLTPDQYMAVASIANFHKDVADIQMSSVEEAAFNGCAAYGTGYALGGATQGLVYAGADAGAGAIVSGVTGCMGGIVNGYVSYSNARSSVIGQSTVEHINRLAGRNDPLLRDVIVATSLVRTRNRTNQPAPGTVPDWGGPRAGTEQARAPARHPGAPGREAYPDDYPDESYEDAERRPN